MIDAHAADRLAGVITQQQANLCTRVATRLFQTFPDLSKSLRIEEHPSPIARLSDMAVGRLVVLVRAMLAFNALSIADNEIKWAAGILPRAGITLDHQIAMVRWLFEEVRHSNITSSELRVAREVEHYLISQLRSNYVM